MTVIHTAAWIIAVFDVITSPNMDCRIKVEMFNLITFNKMDVTLKKMPHFLVESATGFSNIAQSIT